jgi:glycosyltransferase involved in cell wall biosynthesis/ubiquinone/menaquinone biosynthesis C-methylase UbiE
MIIIIDASNIRQGGGITHIVELLANCEPNIFGIKKIILCGCSNLLNKIQDQQWLEKIYVTELDGSLIKRILWKFFSLKKIIKLKKGNILLCLDGINISNFNPSIVFCQNLLPFSWPHIFQYAFSFNFIRLIFLRLIQQYSIQRSAGVIFISEFSKKIILDKIGKYDFLTAVVHHGVNEAFRTEGNKIFVNENFSNSNPMKVVYVSIGSKYKHHCDVIDAIADLRNKGIPISLTLVGPSGDSSNRIATKIIKRDSKGEFIKNLGEIPYEELNKVYASHDLGLFASSCEAFGMILLEKMSSGMTIACSNKSAMPEILVDAGEYFNPGDSKDIASCILKLFNSPQLRKELSLKALNRSLDFTWEKCAYSTFKFIRVFFNSVQGVKNSRGLPGGVEFHDNLASVWSDGYESGSFKKRKYIFDSIINKNVVSGQYWADFGCGSGVLTLCLVENGANVLAVDMAPNMVLRAAENLKSKGTFVSFLEADIESVSSLRDQTFDGVLVSSVFEYLDSPDVALKKVSRLLKPGGKLIISIPLKNSSIRSTQKIINSFSKKIGINFFSYIEFSKFELDQEEAVAWLSKSNLHLTGMSYFDPFLPKILFNTICPSLMIIEATKIS